jgi:hypothetical protein
MVVTSATAMPMRENLAQLVDVIDASTSAIPHSGQTKSIDGSCVILNLTAAISQGLSQLGQFVRSTDRVRLPGTKEPFQFFSTAPTSLAGITNS